MGKLSKVGTVRVSKSEKSFHIIFQSPNNILSPDHLFISRKSLKAVDEGTLNEANLFLLEPDPSGESCENRELRG